MKNYRVELGLLLTALSTLVLIHLSLSEYFFRDEDYTYLALARWSMGESNYLALNVMGGFWFRPLGLAGWRFSYLLFDTSSAGHYLLNIAAHLISVFLLYKFALELKASKRGAFWGAILFAVHPVSTGTTLYLSARFDLLGMPFAIAAMFFALRKQKLLMASFTLIACLFKEVYAILPAAIFALIALHDMAEEKKGWIKSAIVGAIPSVLSVIIYILLRHSVTGQLGGYSHQRVSFAESLMLAPIHAVRSLMIMPKVLMGKLPDSSVSIMAMCALFIIAFVFTGKDIRKKGSRALKSGIALLAIFFVLPSQFPNLVASAPRLSYLPLLGFSIIIASMLPASGKKYITHIPLMVITALYLWASAGQSVSFTSRSIEERKIYTEVMGFIESRYTPTADRESTVVFLGLPKNHFGLCLMLPAMAPRSWEADPDFKKLRTDWLYADRISYSGRKVREGEALTAEKIMSVFDYDFGDRLIIFNDGKHIAWVRKPPDILGLINSGQDILVAAMQNNREVVDVTRAFKEKAGIRGNFIESDRVRTDIEYKALEISKTFVAAGDASIKGLVSTAETAVILKVELVSNGIDPHLSFPPVNINAIEVKEISITISLAPDSGMLPSKTEGELIWESGTDPGYGLRQKITFPVIADGANRTYVVPVGKMPQWYLSGTIRSLRFDPFPYPGAVFIEKITISYY